MLAFAFLAEGAVEPLFAFHWPTPDADGPGPWAEAGTAPPEALRGCLAADLPYWMDDELWRIELAGRIADRDHLLVAERARLLGRIEQWTPPLAREFVVACARRVARATAAALRQDGRADAAARLEDAGDLGELALSAAAAADQASPGATLAGYLADVCHYAGDAGAAARGAAVTAKMSAYALASDVDGERRDDRLESECAWQARWLIRRLGL